MGDQMMTYDVCRCLHETLIKQRSKKEPEPALVLENPVKSFRADNQKIFGDFGENHGKN